MLADDLRRFARRGVVIRQPLPDSATNVDMPVTFVAALNPTFVAIGRWFRLIVVGLLAGRGIDGQEPKRMPTADRK